MFQDEYNILDTWVSDCSMSPQFTRFTAKGNATAILAFGTILFSNQYFGNIGLIYQEQRNKGIL